MKQTAVEFLEKELNELLVLFSTKWDKVNKAIEQAKEMEKQQQNDFAIKFAEWLNTLEAKYLIEDLILVGELNKNPKTKELLKIFKNK
jgi:GTP-binding protein EngB required for normal cell division